ncbi:MAG: UDP-3-O-acyl-N-acetylglucosamine deacetylase, partial [Firmicutes bacterium]|nr:UDP-3-O-acyl-N-acetylglucosamine deacetylase [Bacillota bacterium]
MIMQKTIGKPGKCTGISITGSAGASATFRPARPGTGIVFVRDDLPGQPEIKCSPEYARTDYRWTSLEKDGVRIEHT